MAGIPTFLKLLTFSKWDKIEVKDLTDGMETQFGGNNDA